MDKIDVSTINTIINGVVAVIVAVTGYLVARAVKKLDQKDEFKERELNLNSEMSFACMELSLACCNALTGGHNNGNVEEAKKIALEAKRKYMELEREVLIKEIM